MRHYKQKRKTKDMLPHCIYMQVLYIIKDYPRLKEEYNNIIHETHVNDGQPRGNKTGDPTASKAAKIVSISDKISAIEKAQNDIPLEYRNAIINNIMFGIRYPDYASKNTWSAWRKKYMNSVAKELNLN